ncbi:MAG TPA: LysR family transcriptional regulator [Rhabdochlamydiaceae bacterium]|jgi:DNA-binding transcriptional LysR family regulator
MLLQKRESFLKNLRIADVELFITAAHLKNLGKSASLHHLSQSAASTAIQRVEAAFDTPLCTHEKRQFRLTREGLALLPRIEGWVKQLRDLIIAKDQIPMRIVTTHAIAQIAAPALLTADHIDFKHMRPDQAYAAILNDEADLALVLDNAPWKGVIAAEIGKGYFQLYSSEKDAALKPVLLPEDQMEVLSFQQSWLEVHGYPLPIKSRIPSWSLIAHICSQSAEIGFLPDFLANKCALHPVLWQPASSPYRVLAIYRNAGKQIQDRIQHLVLCLRKVFSF